MKRRNKTMTDEEKKEYIEHEILDRLYCLEENDFDKNKVDDGYIKAVLNACKEAKNLIEKQSKEIEELKEKKGYHLGFIDGGIAKKYEIQDKIKAKIEEVKDGTYDAKIVLQSLLDKK